MLTKSQFTKSVSKGRSVSFTNTNNRKYYITYYFAKNSLRTEYFDKNTLSYHHSFKLNLSSVSDSYNIYRSCSL